MHKILRITLTISLFIFAGETFLTAQGVNRKNKKFNKDIIEQKSLVFFIMGDFGHNGELYQQHVADAMKKTAEMAKPKFIITTGDNFYCCGVASKDDPQWMNSFENVYNGDALQLDWFASLGNHDYSGSVQAEIDYSKKSRKWVMPARYYSIEQKIDSAQKLKLLFVDTSPFLKEYRNKGGKYTDVDLQDTVRQLKWIDSVLASSKNTWKIVIGHHPVYSSSKRGDTRELYTNFKPILEKYKVQAYICGHDHNLQHQRPSDGKIDYFVSGAAADVSDKVESNQNSIFAKSVPGFMVATIKGDILRTYFVDKDLNIIYEYSRKNTD